MNGMDSHLPVVGATSARQDTDRLRKAAQDLEGVFLEQLFKAMRGTVPEGGPFSGGPGEEIFSELMDQHTASEAAGQGAGGLGEALYRQLARSLTPASGSDPDTPAATQ